MTSEEYVSTAPGLPLPICKMSTHSALPGVTRGQRRWPGSSSRLGTITVTVTASFQIWAQPPEGGECNRGTWLWRGAAFSKGVSRTRQAPALPVVPPGTCTFSLLSSLPSGNGHEKVRRPGPPSKGRPKGPVLGKGPQGSRGRIPGFLPASQCRPQPHSPVACRG